jgi:hypothetical protein
MKVNAHWSNVVLVRSAAEKTFPEARTLADMWSLPAPVDCEIRNACLSVEPEDGEYATVAVFPPGTSGVRFVGCNLDNVKLPPGSVVDDGSCCRRQWVLRADLGKRHWPVDAKGKLAARSLSDETQAAVVAELRKAGVQVDVAAVEAACPAGVALDGKIPAEPKEG